MGARWTRRQVGQAKKKAIIAVARKLAVLLHTLWKTGEEYEPLRMAEREAKRKAPVASATSETVSA